ncbi:IPTL-CTERM sorting domain-containing protein [Hydrogenophaga soli]
MKSSAQSLHALALLWAMACAGSAQAQPINFPPAPDVPGICGSASNTSLVTSPPSANLCASGYATAVATGNSSYTWNCNAVTGNINASCSAPRGYTLTPSTGANGNINPNTPQVVAYNNATSFTLEPDVGYTGSASGCGGSLLGNTYTTSAVTADCAVGASFVLNTYAITTTASPLAGGSVSCSPNPVSHGSNATCSAAPSAGYTFSSWGGACSGSGACSLSNVTSAKAVTALFIPVVNGACGSAANTATAYTPTSANLCASNGGTASAVTAGSSAWGWTCSGSSNGGTNATCSAPFATIPGTNGVVGAIQAATTNNWQVNTATSGFMALPAPAPAGVTFSGGATKVVLTGGNLGSQATVVLRFSSIPAGAQLYKYGKETGPTDANKWFAFPATIDRNAGTVTYVLTDGQKGDNDWTLNGTIDDPVGLGMGADVSGVPTLSQWTLLLLAGLLGVLGLGATRQSAGGLRR